ncbi:amidohydrolase family protein [Streptomyces sp. NPDC051985]|uniref:amidohydrolase family protein n=1 Tax=Streptomyces sp. NPDC051985 TaxID=3155807 RepID=UPI003426CB41
MTMTENAHAGSGAGSADRGGPRTGRRQMLAGAAALGATALAAGAVTATPAAAASGPRTFAAGRPILFRGATVVTMDPRRGVLHDTDVLVHGTDIQAVGKHLPAPHGTTVVDTAGALLLPGFVNTHQHMWQAALRGVGADWTLAQYYNTIIMKWGSLFRPQDIYAANYMAMVESVNDGVTTTMDFSHGLFTPEHADAAVDALFAVPGRARFGYSSLAPDLGWVYDGRVDRMLKERFASSDQLVTMQLAFDMYALTDDARRALKHTRDLGLPLSTHAGLYGFVGDDNIRFLQDNGALSPTTTLVHAATLSDDSYRRIADGGAYISLSAESELNAGQGYPPSGKAREFGIPISLSQDTVIWWSADMFSAMRATLSADRGLAHLQAHQAGKSLSSNALRAQDVLEYATIGGARTLGLDRLIGSITPGKRADLVLLGRSSPAMSVVNNPAGHIVFQAGRGDVDTVLVNGRVLKHRGTLVGVDLQRARHQVQQSLEYLRSKIPAKEWQQAMGE